MAEREGRQRRRRQARQNKVEIDLFFCRLCSDFLKMLNILFYFSFFTAHFQQQFLHLKALDFSLKSSASSCAFVVLSLLEQLFKMLACEWKSKKTEEGQRTGRLWYVW